MFFCLGKFVEPLIRRYKILIFGCLLGCAIDTFLVETYGEKNLGEFLHNAHLSRHFTRQVQ